MIVALACMAGCGKKETKPQASSQSQPSSAAPDPAKSPAPATAPAAPANTYEAQVTARSIDYFKGQIAQKNWAQARQALATVEARQLTPAQRQQVDSLKAQLPPK